MRRAAALLIALVLSLPLPLLGLAQDVPVVRETPTVRLAAQLRPSVFVIFHGSKICCAGFVADPDGLLVTCAHCVDGVKEVKVRLADGREYQAKVLISNKDHDIAILKIDTKGLKAIKVPAVDDVMIGETVLAVGHPFGEAFTTSKGIVSAINRTVTLGDEQVFTGLIQTDTPINPGNSGGPLVNMAGELAGVVNCGLFGADGLGYAVGTGTVRAYLAQAKQMVQTGGCCGGGGGTKIDRKADLKLRR